MTGSVAPLHVWLVGAAGAAKSPVLATVFVHPNNGSETSNQFIRHHQVSDGLRIAFSDVLALFGTVARSPRASTASWGLRGGARAGAW